MLGAVVVPINFRFVAPEVSYIVKNSDASAILYGEEFQGVIDRVKERLTEVEVLDDSGFNPGGGSKSPFKPSTLEEAKAIDKTGPGMFDEAFILYTSGTTGKPKGAVITHYNMVWNQARIVTSPPITWGRRHDEPIALFPFRILGPIPGSDGSWGERSYLGRGLMLPGSSRPFRNIKRLL